MSLSNKSYEELEKASIEWSNCQKKVIILDEGKRAVFSRQIIHIQDFYANVDQSTYRTFHRIGQNGKQNIYKYSCHFLSGIPKL